MDILVFASEQWILVTVLVSLIMLYFWNEKRRSGQSISTHEATRLINSDTAVLIDIREANEFKTGHIANAINMPYTKMKNNLSQFDVQPDKTVILVDKLGTHTAAIGRELVKAGRQVCRLEGGMSEWQNQKLPVVK
ncbi:rhodanese-like domain-containing protein [Sessilibacter corallicola]|nr:rhodanese-like domain-containing protein [Sessilibacter corallicola]